MKLFISKTITIMVLLTFVFVLVFSSNIYAIEETNDLKSSISARSFALLDSKTGNVLLENDKDTRMPLASVTKVMTMLLVMEAIENSKISMDQKITISEYAAHMGGSQVYLEAGEIFSVEELLKAVAVHSANDAATALAEAVAGSEGAFADEMNKKSKELKMNNTFFIDCTGLTDNGHYSTSYDVALMSMALINQYPQIFEFVSIIHDTFRNGEFLLDNSNNMLKVYQGCNGLKTGFTNKAGFCLSATAKREDLTLIAVVLGEPDKKTRTKDISALLDYGFAKYETEKICSKGDVVGNLKVKKGMVSEIDLVFQEDIYVTLEKGKSKDLVVNKKMIESIDAPIDEESDYGFIEYTLDNKVIKKVVLKGSQDVEKASYVKIVKLMFSVISNRLTRQGIQEEHQEVPVLKIGLPYT